MVTELAPPTTSRALPKRNQAAQGPQSGSAVFPVRARRSWGYGAAAIAAIVVGGLLSAFLYSSTQHSEQVFVVATALDRGQTIAAQDLTTITITPGQRIDAFTPAQAGQLIGKTITAALPKGSLLTHGAVADRLPIPAGEAIVGVALKPSQMPSTPISAGSRIVITPIAGQNATVKSTQAADVPATVVDQLATNQSTGLVIVNVYIASRDASDVAGRAAAGLVTLYVEPGA
jgi:hypothetical protein